MTFWQIILIICGAISVVAFIIMLIILLTDDKKFENRDWYMLLAALFIIPVLILMGLTSLWEYLSEVWKDGGFRKHYRLIKEKEAEIEAYHRGKEAEKAEYERIKEAYLNGELTREELPRTEDGIETFEFEEEMGLSTDYWANVREIVYVENEYNEVLNDFFDRHQDLRLFRMYKFVYLPIFCKVVGNEDMIRYLFPNASEDRKTSVKMDSSYPIQYLWYKENATRIKHGMMFFLEADNHGAKYIKGHYYHLEEGNDDEIIAQLDTIVRKIHDDYSNVALYSKEEWKQPELEEGSTDEYADALCPWVVTDDNVANIAQEIRDRIKVLREMGMGRKFIMSLFEEKPKPSRLLITKDLRIFLPDYNNMEIKMEPINKAVYFLFLNHPEGIIFKHLPDYRKELADIYQKIKPLGLNERAIQSIEDVTNPCLNSINEKCARIRGAFVSKFDCSLAEQYYIIGLRGDPKKIALSRDLVIWE